MWQILKEKHLIKGTILDFSPPRIIYRNLKKHTGIEYYSSDFENEFIADYHFDITKIEKEANSFDLIMCFHILEHISNDEKAINELYRVLKKEGIGLIQTPFKEGDIYEDYTIVSEEERLKAFGQEDHVRVYSVKGLTERLEKSGFKVTSIEQQPIPHLGINTETILLVKK
ncbi:class I SAM-dependent methyltransferase [Paenimyroides ceti]